MDTQYPDLSRYKYAALDTETTGLRWWKDRAFGLAISTPDGRDWYMDLRVGNSLRWAREHLPELRHRVFHNAKFDLHFLRELGIRFVGGYDECTMINAALIDEHRLTYDLDSLGRDYVGIGKATTIWEELAGLFGGPATRDAQAENLQHAPEELVARYAKQDTRTTLALWEWQQHQLEIQDLWRVHALEHDLLPRIVRMEQGGVRADLEATERASLEFARRIEESQERLNRMAGFEVNVNPSNSLQKLIVAGKRDGQWYARDGSRLRETPGGKAQIDQWALRELKMPEAALVLDIRNMRRTKETFLEGHILGHHNRGLIHANYNQTKSDNDRGTGTGRLSINSPALQQIHKRNKSVAAVVRALFIPEPGMLWYCRDWSQMDFRVFAHYASDPNILEVYKRNPDADFHSLVASLTGLPRNRDENTGGGNAKQINLGMVFGMGGGKLASEMGLPFYEEEEKDDQGRVIRVWMRPGEEAQAVFAKYHGAIPGVRGILKSASSVARSRGFIRTAMGRRIRFPDPNFCYKAGGLLFQGSAADALKVKICEVDDYFQAEGGGRLMLNVHDEFDCEVEPDKLEKVDRDIEAIVNDFGPDAKINFRVPIRSDGGWGPNWWEASK